MEVPGGATPPTSSRATSVGPSSAPPDSIKPCSLLSAADTAALGITGNGKGDEVKGATSCLWRVEKPLAADSYSIDVTFFGKQSVGDLVAGGEKTPVRVGRHDGVRAVGVYGPGCVVALEITSTSRVDVRTIGRGDSALLCERAVAVAGRVEARLP
ncbi:DUF3558 family protein [Actinokineospora diospyrosa]|uniref:DUF3558 family protein n=1 Tax=Actinokineospora diospyrosa TaxID=103728 RepID=UPI0035585B94